MKYYKLLVSICFLSYLIACNKNPLQNFKDATMKNEQNDWIYQLDSLGSQNLLNQSPNQLSTFTDTIKASLSIMTGKSTVIDNLSILGTYKPFSPKMGPPTVYSFFSNVAQTSIHINSQTKEIENIYISSGANVFNLSEVEFSKLNLIFLKNEISEHKDEDNDFTYTINKVFALDNAKDIKVIFIRNYYEDSQIHEKVKFEYDKQHLNDLKIFNSIRITKK